MLKAEGDKLVINLGNLAKCFAQGLLLVIKQRKPGKHNKMLNNRKEKFVTFDSKKSLQLNPPNDGRKDRKSRNKCIG